jgi:soluble lytic murein transglycosylase-like protein
MRSIFILLAAMCVWSGDAAACWQQAGERYAVSPQLLVAIARVESNLDPRAINLSHQARTGTYDIGLMQINSSHLPRLASYGISESDLYEPCMNIHVGAWLLADSFARHGATWNGVGAYNAACTKGAGPACDALRSGYAWRVYRALVAQAQPKASTTAARTTPPRSPGREPQPRFSVGVAQ